MSLIVKAQGGDFELPPAGTYVAICYRIIDLGTQQTEGAYGISRNKKVSISWEFPDEKMADGKRVFSIHKRYTLSLSEKATLRHDLESWRGVAFTAEEKAGFDISVLLGKPCLIGVVHETNPKGQKFANISSILKLPKGMPIPERQNPIIGFYLDDFDQSIYDSFSDSLKATIAKSPEYQELKGVNIHNPNIIDDNRFAPIGNDLSDEIPF